MAIHHLMIWMEDGPVASAPMIADSGEMASTGGRYGVACMGNKRPPFGPDFHATGEAWVVTCKQCRKTKQYKDLLIEQTPDKIKQYLPEEDWPKEEKE